MLWKPPTIRATALAGLLAAVLLAGLAAGAPAAGPDARASGPPVPKLDWRDCDDGFECATAVVPRDYDRPNGATIELALVRRPAGEPESRIGSLFVNPGGPGGSGIDFVREAPAGALAIIGRRYDIVGFDPRGVGASRPAVDCVDPPPSTEPVRFVTPETLDVASLLAAGRDRVERCLAGPHRELAPHLTTANVARDLDLLRAAVGDAKLSYFGLSYGALIGETYATLFPGRARAMVLDSPVDGDVWLNRPDRRLIEQLAGFERALDRFFVDCAADQDACGFGGSDPEEAFDALVERLNRTPLPVPGGPAVSGDEVRSVVLDLLYRRGDWPVIAEVLARLEAGDGSFVRQVGGQVGLSGSFAEQFRVWDTNEPRWPSRTSDYVEAGEHVAGMFEHLPFLLYERVDRMLWPVKPRNAFYGPYRNAPGAAPILVLASTHDPATPYAWAKRVVSDLGNARLVTVRGDGHGVITQLNACALGIFLAFIEDGTLPPAGATCDQQPQLATRAASEWRFPIVRVH